MAKSSDGGLNWSSINLPTGGNYQWEADIAFNPMDNKLYALFYTDDLGEWDIGEGQLLSYNGIDWDPVIHTFADPENKIAGYVTQLRIDPQGIIYAGGVRIFRSSDNGVNFSQCGNQIHDDIRDIAFFSTGMIGFMATDGGIVRNLNTFVNYDWKSINGNISISQFYKLTSYKQNPDIMLGGCHDNGTFKRIINGHWIWCIGGDGSSVAMKDDNNDNNYVLVNGRPYRKESGLNFNYICMPELNCAHWAGLPYYDSPVLLHQNSNEVFIGSARKGWWSDNTDPLSWSSTHPYYTDYNIAAIGVCPVDKDNVIIDAFNISTSAIPRQYILRSLNKNDNTSWSDIESSFGNVTDFYHITDIEYHPDNCDRIWITFSGFLDGQHVFYSEDGGTTWANITHNLNLTYDNNVNIPTNCIAYDVLNGGLFLGTDFGIYYLPDGATTWEKFEYSDFGFPDAMVNDLSINYKTGELIIGTYGRGAWRARVQCPTYSSVPLSITSNVIWNSVDYRINRIIEIEQGATLTIENGSNVQFGIDAGIKVKPGGKLIVDNSVLTNLDCDVVMWQGIEVQGNSALTQTYTNQGVIEIKNDAIIENAYIAINAKAGAIVKAENCTMSNNVTGVRFEPYNNFNPVTLAPRINLSSFKNCTFETTRELNDNTQYPEAFVLLNGVNGIDFLGNTFQNTVPMDFVVTKRGIGIKSINSGYNVNAFCTSTMSPCPPTQYKNNEFTGLCCGIHAQNTTSTYPVIVNRSNFINNNRGIFMSGINNPTITLNNFDVGATEFISGGITPPPPYKNTTPATMVLPGFGLYLYKIQTFNVQENEFYSNNNGYYGSIIWNCGAVAKDFYNNNYRDLKIGFQSSSNNSGLQIKCNEFVSDIAIADIGITSGSIANHQGKCVLDNYILPAGNLFSHTGGNAFDIKANNNVVPFYYHYHNGNPTTPFTYSTGIVTLSQCMAVYTPEACPSRLNTGNTPSQLLTNITALNNEFTALSSNIDGGSTQVMLDKVNSTLSSAQLKNELLATPTLSDTVMIATLMRPQTLTPGHIKEILVPNSPLTDKVIKVLNEQTLPPGIKTEIQAAQTGESERSILEQQISIIETERTLAVSELMQLYAEDTTGTGPANIIAFLETQPDVNSKQILVQSYYSSGECSEAQNMLEQLPKLTSDEIDFYTLYSILAELCTAGNTVYDLSPVQKQVVETLALSNSMVSANAQAIMSQVYGEWYWEKIEELLDFNTVTIKGTLFGNPDCDNTPVPNDTLLIVDENGEAVLGVNPVITNENGEFIFSPNELTLLDSTALYSLKTKSGYSLSEVPHQTILEWINQSPLTLTLKNVNLEWYDLYDSPDSIWSIGTKIDINGNIYVAGRTRRINVDDDVVIMKYSPQGLRLWETIYASGINTYENANDMITDANGNCYISLTSINTNVVLLKYNSNGQLLWSSVLNNTTDKRYDAMKVKLTTSGNLYLAGHISTIPGGTSDIFIAMLDKNGTQKWVKTFNFNDFDLLSDMTIDKNDNIIITGYTYSQSEQIKRCITAKFNKNGALTWSQIHTDVFSAGIKVATDNTSNIIVSGRTGIGSQDLIILKYNPSGIQQWTNTLSLYYLSDMIVDNDNKIYICGAGNTDIFIAKYSTTGAQEWIRAYNGAANGYDNATAMYPDQNNNIYLTGFASINPVPASDKLRDMVTLKFNPNGELIWDVVFNKLGHNINSGNDLVVSENDNVYITGQSGTAAHTYMTTIKYSQCPSQSTLRSNIFYETENSESDIQVINFNENTITVYPNPYSDNTLIELVLLSDADVSLEVFTITGQSISNVYTGAAKAGTYTYNFSAKKLGYSAGTYILKATINNDVTSYWLVEMK